MSKFDGFVCDLCNTVAIGNDRTIKTVRYEGLTNGEYKQELCPTCVVVPEDVTLRPLRRRGPNRPKVDAGTVPG